ncbi:hypothetical protein Moror_8549 [Moniliophthora roreri MCA 2997]|uniref:Uncharacterized protein n=1 Tax=Moniliophthora roreri (strain MCA 2997) TaxID=1381753 RepID=V2WQG1_MONRO|nr:hypothetical protein Moror_8549 [Moniliophthora roreri MCA 2997]
MVSTPSTAQQHHDHLKKRRRRHNQKHAAIAAVIGAVASLLPSIRHEESQPMRTSMLTGELWMHELLTGNERRFSEQLMKGLMDK